MARSVGIQWTNRSVLGLAQGEDPIAVIERKARDLVLRARDAGWQGPPFNPAAIADLLNIPVEANANVADARIVPTEKGLRIQFNPTQARERVRFSIAHELAHTLFPDVADEVRHRGGTRHNADDWQLEILCNLAAAEFVMPIGSLPAREQLPKIETLMNERRRFDVSVEAFLIRVTKIASEPVLMFCASPVDDQRGKKQYRVDYAVPSKGAPDFPIVGRMVPSGSAVHTCTGIGFTDTGTEKWFSHDALKLECVGIPAYPGANYPRVAGLIRFSADEAIRDPVRFVHGDIFEPRGSDLKVICQLVNDQARFWGGGIAKVAARKFPQAQREFSAWITTLPRPKRLGEVHFAQTDETTFLASLIGQEGFGSASTPRIRYAALEHCLERVSEFASKRRASVHMPRLGTGQSGGSWDTVEEIIRDTLVNEDVPVMVYDLPPKRIPNTPGFLD